MSARTAGRLAWSLWGLTMALEVAAIWLWLGNRSLGGGYFAPQVFLVPGFATVGALIAASRANTVGWLFVGLGLLAASHAVTMAYAERDTLIDPASLPAGSLIGLLAGWLWPQNYLLLCLILLLFPDGRLPSPRWRPAARFILVAWGVSILLTGFGGWVYTVCGARCPAGDTMRRSDCLDRLGGSCGHCTPPPPGAGARAGSQAPPSMGSPRTGCPLITRRSLSRTRGS